MGGKQRIKPSTAFHDGYDVDPETGCWIWRTGPSQRYGVFRYEGRQQRAHRASWQMHYGPIPGNQYVCHKCDEPRCVNPQHLFIGSQRDNMTDCVRKLRIARGEDNPRTKLNDFQIRVIQRAGYRVPGSFWAELWGIADSYANRLRSNGRKRVDKPRRPSRFAMYGRSHVNAKLTEKKVRAIRADTVSSESQLAAKYNVSRSLIGLVRRRQTWKHVE